MTRPLRINLAGGWYHVTARGNNRQAIYDDNRDRGHFLDLIGEMIELHRVRVHAYVLMTNHYHLLIETPEANISQAIQWLNVSYSVWFNKRHESNGHLFQGRFHSVLMEEGAWSLEVSQYLHLNPVRVAGLGLGKADRKQYNAGRKAEPSAEQVSRWLTVLRGYRWSSYLAYAGYEQGVAWLTKNVLWKRLRGQKGAPAAKYRREVEGQITGQQKESPWLAVRAGVVLGTKAFLDRAREVLKGDEDEQPGLKELRVRSTFEDVVRALEREKGERWEQFCERRGDWGRDMALLVARGKCGLTQRELGETAGGLRAVAVNIAVRRMANRIEKDKSLKQIYDRVMARM